MPDTLQLPAPAKINLFLHITGQRKDGYHTLQTAFQFIELFDLLSFTPTHNNEIRITCDGLDIPHKHNLIYRAAHLLQPHTNAGCLIHLEKHIPTGAGLGGGSSDAATTLLALNHLWGLSHDLDTLSQLGATLGADIPVFIHGQAAWAEGIGDRFSPFNPPTQTYLVIKPNCHASTPYMYQHPELPRQSLPMDRQTYRYGDGHNDFEKLAAQLYPEIASALDWLNQFSSARLTGSGAAVFAAFQTPELAHHVAAKAPEAWQTLVAKGLNQSPVHTQVAHK